MTAPNLFTPINQSTDRLDIARRGNQPMIVKVWDNPEYVRTPHNKDGMVRIDGRDPFPNRAVRALVVDLGDTGADGLPGKVYPETWFQAASMMKTMKGWVGQLKLITWLQDVEPKDQYGNPRQTNPYTITDHSGNAQAVAMATEYLERHPEFHDIPAPAPYDGKPPAPPQTPQDPWGWGQQPPQQQWNDPNRSQQPPAQWNTAAPPQQYQQQPGYGPPQGQGYPQQAPPQGPPQQWGPPPQQPQSAPPAQGWGQPPQQQGPPPQQYPPQQTQPAPGSFFAASQGQQAPQYPPQVGPQGQWQNDEPPF